MKSLSPFPHDASYDADFVNGEIFDGTDDLSTTATPLREAHDSSRETESGRASGSQIFDGNDDLSKVGSVAPRGPLRNVGCNVTLPPSAQDARPARSLECGDSAPLSLLPIPQPKSGGWREFNTFLESFGLL
jgi:hypothetical protein